MRSIRFARLACNAIAACMVSFGANAQDAKPAPCSAPEHRQFDFWLGDWEVKGPAGKVAGRNMVPFYSLVYRGRADFQTERLLDTRRLAAPPSRFWSAFFVGAVVTPKTAVILPELVPPASLRSASSF